MTIDQFIAMTLRVVGEDGLDEYLPTLVLPKQREVRALEAIPEDVSDESAALEWAGRTVAGNEDYFLAFKVSEKRLKFIARIDGNATERLIDVDGPS